jgi:hypothetical protein
VRPPSAPLDLDRRHGIRPHAPREWQARRALILIRAIDVACTGDAGGGVEDDLARQYARARMQASRRRSAHARCIGAIASVSAASGNTTAPSQRPHTHKCARCSTRFVCLFRSVDVGRASSVRQVLMWIPLAILFPASVFTFSYVVDMVAERTAFMALQPELYNWTYPCLGDLVMPFVSLIVLLFLRVTLCRFVFTPLGRWILPSIAEKRGKWTEAAREDRVQRFSVCVFK